MPKMYEAIRDKEIAKGVPQAEAKTFASKVYNARRKKKPSLPKLSNKPDSKS